jgi:ubiquinone/menaquinone biosynthesis C-methylase UbiE
MKKWYRELFQDYAKTYETEDFTKGTLGEIDFIEKEIGQKKSIKILDVGCGTGRHSIELAKRGYKVTGIDLSECMLETAIKRAKEDKVKVEFIKADARDLKYDKEFDLVIMICEGGFPLMDEMNFKILESSARALKKNGKFIFTTLNGLFPLFHSFKDFTKSSSNGANTFDLMTFRDISTIEVTDDNGKKKKVTCDERYYIPSEITWMLKTLGFAKIDICGCKIGAFSRNDKLTPDDFEMLVIAEY